MSEASRERPSTGVLEAEQAEQAQETRRQWPFYALFLGNTVSFAGDIMTFLAVPWFVLQTTGSVEQAGITGFFAVLPTVFSGFFGSVLVDRLGYKRTSVLGDILCGLTVMLVPLLYHTIGLAFWQLLTLVFIGGLLRSPADTARWSLVPDLAKLAGMRLERANAWNDGSRRGANFLGAPLAGVLIAVIGTSNLLWLDAASFAFSALLIGCAVPALAPHQRAETPRESGRSYVAEMREGLRFIRADVVILTMIIVLMITNMIDDAYSAVVAPTYVMRTFHSAIPLGVMVSVFGGMAFLGTVIFGAIGHRLPRRLTLGVGFIIGGASRFWLLLFAGLPLILGWYALAGLAIGPINSLISTTLQERVPPEMRARVYGLVGAGVMAAMPLGTLASGFVVTWIGLNWTLVMMGVLYLLATLSILLNPTLKQINRAG